MGVRVLGCVPATNARVGAEITGGKKLARYTGRNRGMKHQNRFTPAEDAVLREHYAAKGATWVALSGLIRDIWNPLAVRYRAAKLKLHVEAKITRNDGLRDIKAFEVRCEVDEFGCWLYRGAYGKAKKPAVYLPDRPHSTGRPGVYTPQRAAYMLSGKRLPPGWLVYQKSMECAAGCCNPAHLTAGNRATMLRHSMRKPEVVNSPARRAQYERIRLDKAHPVELVRAAQAHLANGLHPLEVAKLTGISETTVRVIRDGRHVHCTRAQSSVFNLAMAA
jgi:hypothetical protein